MLLGFQMIKRYYLPMSSGGQGAGEGGLILSWRFSFPKTPLLTEHSLIFLSQALVYLCPLTWPVPDCSWYLLPSLQTARAGVAGAPW